MNYQQALQIGPALAAKFAKPPTSSPSPASLPIAEGSMSPWAWSPERRARRRKDLALKFRKQRRLRYNRERRRRLARKRLRERGGYKLGPQGRRYMRRTPGWKPPAPQQGGEA